MTEDEIKQELCKIALGRRDSIDKLAAYLASLAPAPAQPQQAQTKKAKRDENG